MFTLNIITHSQAYFTLYFQTKNSHYLQNKKLTIKLTNKKLPIKLAKQETNN